MIKFGILGAIFVLVAAAVMATIGSGDESGVDRSDNYSYQPVDILALEQRLSTLEQALNEERQHRIELEARLAGLQNGVASISLVDNGNSNQSEVLAEGADIPEDLQSLRDQIEARRAETRGNAEERQLASLIEAGFDPFEAEEIIRKTEEMQMDLLNARFQAAQNGESLNFSQAQAAATAELRASLGDSDYERYLEATNQSTSVAVSNVLASSPAEVAGIQTGDEIVSYNGERVFNTADLNRLSNSVELSGNVLVEVIRDGQPVSLSLPSGPLGITSGRGGFGGRR